MDAKENEHLDVSPAIAELIQELREALSPKKRKIPRPPKAVAAPYKEPERSPAQLAKDEKRRASKLSKEARLSAITRYAEMQAKARAPKTCFECKAELPVTEDSDLLPGLCKRCESRNAELAVGFKPKTQTEFSSVKVVQGGAPGSGRRR